MQTLDPASTIADKRGSKVCGLFFSFPQATEMFHFAWCPLATYEFSGRVIEVHSTGFPHSEIFGLTVACHLPEAYRRLLRPSSALPCLVIHHLPLCAIAIQILFRKQFRMTSWCFNINCKCVQSFMLAHKTVCLAHIIF